MNNQIEFEEKIAEPKAVTGLSSKIAKVVLVFAILAVGFLLGSTIGRPNTTLVARETADFKKKTMRPVIKRL